VAIALRAVGTRLKVDTSVGAPGSGTQNVSLPAGHVANDALVMFVLTDDNTNLTSDPSGWTRLFFIAPGSSVGVPYTPRPHLKVYYRVDNGSLGSTVTLNVDAVNSWPTGKPEILAFIVAYSGCDTSNPVGEWDWSTTTSTTAAQAHPQLTLSQANDWLLSYRAVSSDSPGATFTNSVGTDVERQDDIDTINELACATYDSNLALSSGLQTQRTTTASRAATYGSIMVSLALRPASAANVVTALAGLASGIGTAFGAATESTTGPWDLCATNGLPEYSLAIDWDQTGFTVPGTVINSNPYVTDDLSDWVSVSATMGRVFGILSPRIPVLGITSTASATPRAATSHWPVTAGNQYLPYGWLMAPVALPVTAYLGVNWYDGSNVFISTSSSPITLNPGSWALFNQLVTAPAGAAFGSLIMVESGTPGAGFVLYGYGLMLIDPATSGTVSVPGPGEEVETDLISDMSVSYGRDQDRQLSPGAVGTAGARLVNVSRTYSPDVQSSPLFNDLDPARDARMQVVWAGQTFPIFRGKIDDYNINADYEDRSVSFSFLDGLSLLQGVTLSTGVYESLRTGDIIDVILDAVNWTGPRDIDLGATVVKFWWAEGTDALSAVQEIVKSEGPPAVAYVSSDGTFIFRDRHHRLQRQHSVEIQGTFVAKALGDCTAVTPVGLNIAKPFTYAHGWRDIINSVSFDVSERVAALDLEDVWTSEDTIVLSTGQGISIDISGSDPFTDAIVPVAGTDFQTTGVGTVNVTLNRTSGQSVQITLLAVGSPVTISGLKLRARPIPVLRTIKIQKADAGSISSHGERTYPDAAPWANANDAGAIADMILLHYARRRPTVQLRTTTSDPTHFLQVLQRTISDRIHITNNEMGIDDDFFVERVTHTIQRINQAGLPPVHSVVLGCERDLILSDNPFTFDKRGAGFDDGVFDPISADDPGTVFVFDSSIQGLFDTGRYGT